MLYTLAFIGNAYRRFRDPGFFLADQGALLKATQPPLPDVPPAAGARPEYGAGIPRLPEEGVGD